MSEALTSTEQPSRGAVGMLCLITAETAIFIIFVVAYVFYIGKSISGPTPQQILDLPIFTTICLLSSSLTIHLAVTSLRRDALRRCSLWIGVTALLGTIFLAGTAREWYRLIYIQNFTIRTNLFGTTFYSLIGLHATHVIAGLFMLALALVFSLRSSLTRAHSGQFEVLSYYWHFVDAVWVVVFSVVYVIGK